LGGSLKVDLSWTTPASNGGSPITGYRIQRSTDGTTGWTNVSIVASTSTTVALTQPLGTYYYRVAVTNGVGYGPYSNVAGPATVVPQATAPGAPTALTALGGIGKVDLAWTAPASNGGSTITGYRIQRSADGTTGWSDVAIAASTATSTALYQPLGTYYFRVAVTNAVGYGSYSNVAGPATVITAPVAPGAPTGLTAVGGTLKVDLSWTAPASNGGTPITGYKVQRSVDGSTGWQNVAITASTSTSATLTQPVGTYYYRLTVTNAVGYGPYSASAGPTTVTP
jgi:predicted phage tail protein